MNTSDTVIETRSLTTGYVTGRDRREVTSGLSAALMSGRMVSLLGTNGSGKSTLLRTLSGIQPALSGEVLISGKPIGEYKSRELAHTLSMVLTERPQLEDMNVEALVGLGRAPYTDFWGRMRAEDRKAVSEAIDMTGIGELSHRQVQTLSDGERQKVMIAKALAQQTPVIFLDEPTAFLDYPSKVEVMMLLRRIAHDMDKTIFMSTHDLDMALQISDVLWLIDRKFGVQIGTHSALTENGMLERYFARPDIRFDSTDGLFKLILSD
ncbi:MAG: ABC transporter ATP-binding protein [Muribaculaceae bacterium]|nr:ABC transporter ATP-binding protein [Muribaculaceae bacterium]